MALGHLLTLGLGDFGDATLEEILAAIEAWNIVIAPVVGTAPDRGSGVDFRTYSGETWTQQIAATDSDGDVVNFATLGTLQFVLEADNATDSLVIEDGSLNKQATYCGVTIPAAYNVADYTYLWSIRKTTNDIVVVHGRMSVTKAAQEDEEA